MAGSIALKFLELGINLQACFELNQMPQELQAEISKQVPESAEFKYMALFGNGGTRYWQSVQNDLNDDAHPVDSFFIRSAERLFGNAKNNVSDYKIVYPGNHFVPLQQLGKLAGWHHDSTMGLGIHPEFGLWFAYRGVVLFNCDDTRDFKPYLEHTAQSAESPCDSCEDKPCIPACPAKSITEARYDVSLCTDYRMSTDSSCQYRCISRQVCPIGKKHRYLSDQLKYHYEFSLEALRKYYS